MPTVIIYGPQGCGKTHNAEALAAHFKAIGVIDDWAPDRPLTPHALHLTNQDLTRGERPSVPGSRAPRILSFLEAMAIAGIPIARPGKAAFRLAAPAPSRPPAPPPAPGAAGEAIIATANFQASLAAASKALPQEIERAVLVARVRRIHYEAAIAQGFTPEQALALCMKPSLA